MRVIMGVWDFSWLFVKFSVTIARTIILIFMGEISLSHMTPIFLVRFVIILVLHTFTLMINGILDSLKESFKFFFSFRCFRRDFQVLVQLYVQPWAAFLTSTTLGIWSKWKSGLTLSLVQRKSSELLPDFKTGLPKFTEALFTWYHGWQYLYTIFL